MYQTHLKIFKPVAGVVMIILIVVANWSCHNSNPSLAKDDTSVATKTPQTDSLFEQIHKDLYENPKIARSRATRILDTTGAENQEIKIRLLKYIGSSYVLETNYSEGIKYYNQALSIAEKTHAYSEIANINNNLGVIFNEIGSYRKAYIHLIEALKNYDLGKNSEKKIGALNNIGLTYLYLKNYEKALSFFDQALDPLIQPKDSILVVSVMNNIAMGYMSEQKPDTALDYLQRAIAISNRINNEYGLCISYQLMGNLYLEIDQATKAFDAYTHSAKIAEKTRLSYQLAVARLGLARVLLSQDKTGKAREVAEDVMHMADEQNSLVLKSEVHEVLAKIYEKGNDYQKSLEHYRKHIKAQQEVINQTVIQQVYDVEVNYLNQLNKMQQLELDKKELTISKKNNLLFFVSLFFVMLLVGFYLAYLNHRHRQKVKLQKMVIELTEKKSNAAMEAEIQERKRIGQELHDSLGHLLSLAGLHASVLYKKRTLLMKRRGLCWRR